MKKMSFLLLAAITLVLLTSCKSEAAKAVDDAISSLGEITLESEKDISTVENMVNSLEEDDFKQLDNLDELRKARETYEALVLEKAIDQVEDAINSIGKVTLNSQPAIDKARELFNHSEKEVQEGVQNSDVLEAAEKELHSLRAGEVEKLISQIGEVTIEKEEQIRNANSEFDALTTEEKNLVSNKDILTESLEILEKQIEEKKAAELEEALSRIKVEKDNIEGVVRYYPTAYPEYINIRTYMLPWIFENSSGGKVLHITINYTGKNWIFFQKATVLVDGERYEMNFGYFAVDRASRYGTVVENVDIVADEDDIEMLNKIASSDSAEVRLSGDNYKYEWTISEADKRGITELLDVYELMK